MVWQLPVLESSHVLSMTWLCWKDEKIISLFFFTGFKSQPLSVSALSLSPLLSSLLRRHFLFIGLHSLFFFILTSSILILQSNRQSGIYAVFMLLLPWSHPYEMNCTEVFCSQNLSLTSANLRPLREHISDSRAELEISAGSIDSVCIFVKEGLSFGGSSAPLSLLQFCKWLVNRLFKCEVTLCPAASALYSSR